MNNSITLTKELESLMTKIRKEKNNVRKNKLL